MREIKFRAWDDKRKKYLEYEEYDKDEYYDNIFSCLCQSLADCNKSYILEQYTGRKDKNGIEIYEGDRVVSDRIIPEGAVIIWDDYYACFSIGSDWPIYDYLIDDDEYPLEVIGNIHENPELLEVTHENQ